ncbi:PREDICTED: uncharacterized protein LOC104800050 isoform X1 [Tarenaya hassleriana]|uniref:uncharacterized protein LOC104800050 isoform X1 n=1 Tax=Tarenaya hassleriana TaxID=28532 RepID=UPI00053CA1F9|nr:PREDICTED: uncharacterized protein LOC104800050 isoform X1 [Tarenaya hassleriana]
MASFSGRLSVAAAAIIVQFLSLAAEPPPTEFISIVCQRVTDKAYCLKALTENPQAVAANGLFPLAEVAIGLGKAHAEKTLAFIDETVKKEPPNKAVYAQCRDAYAGILASFGSAAAGLKSTPDTANYDVMVSRDETSHVTALIGKNDDVVSKTLLAMNDQMSHFIDLASGATDSVDDDDENTFRRE